MANLVSATAASDRLSYESELLPPGEQLVHADIAEQALEGLIPAAQYRGLDTAHAGVASASVTAENGTVVGQIIFGEIFDILFRRAGRAYGRARRDGTVGWVAEDALKTGPVRVAYRVNSLEASLPFNALVAGDEGIEAGDLVPVGSFDDDIVEVASRFIGCAFRPGARSSVEVDGVGLVQQALMACGYAAPRRAADMERLGQGVDRDDAGAGDIVVWSRAGQPYAGHAGVLLDAHRVVHASPVSGKVQTEPLADVVAGLSDKGYGAPVVRRLRL